jgi:hypothetical protein
VDSPAAPPSAFLPDRGLTLVGGVPVFHLPGECRIWHDLAIEDALGEARGGQLKALSAQTVHGHLLREVAREDGLDDPAERLRALEGVFRWMGLGDARIDLEAMRADVTRSSFFAAWRNRHAGRTMPHLPGDPVALGMVAAMAAIGLRQPIETVSATLAQDGDTAWEEGRMALELRTLAPGKVPAGSIAKPMNPAVLFGFGREPEAGLNETRIAALTQDVRAALAQDGQGGLAAYGLPLALQCPEYHFGTGFDALRHLEGKDPAFGGLLEGILRESGRIAAFHGIGGVLAAPGFRALAGDAFQEDGEIVSRALAVARAMGFGLWQILDFSPGKRLVVRATSTLEAPIWIARHGLSSVPRCYFLQGAALAIMTLASELDWGGTGQRMDAGLYAFLFRPDMFQWRVRQTACPTMGGKVADIVVERDEVRLDGAV